MYLNTRHSCVKENMESAQFKKMVSLSSPIIYIDESMFPYSKSIHLPVQDQQQNRYIYRTLRCGHVSKLMCAKEGGSSSLPSQVDKKRSLEEELCNDELIGTCQQNDNCEEGLNGMIESLECLEREAIMGEYEGREPTDYNRRAQIFDKSSKVFQALKEDDDHRNDAA